jgi:molecular chaperone GrpE
MEETKTAVNAEEELHAEQSKDTAKADKKKAKKQDAEIAELQKQLDEKTAECEACNDKYMRMMAEYDNFRKRSAKEKEGVYADAYSDCIANLLPILDNLERASKSDNFEAVTKGLEMTVKAFDDAMEKMGVSEIECKTFDPNLHNAVMHVEDEQYGEGEIVEVFQKGYCKGDKVIRYAMVKVAN